MGGRGQRYTDSKFSKRFMARYTGNENIDNRTRVFNENGIRFDSREEEIRARAAIVRFTAINKPDIGEILYIPVETDPSGGAYRYTVKVTGYNPYDYIIIGKVGIKNGAY